MAYVLGTQPMEVLNNTKRNTYFKGGTYMIEFLAFSGK